MRESISPSFDFQRMHTNETHLLLLVLKPTKMPWVLEINFLEIFNSKSKMGLDGLKLKSCLWQP